jgi:hypothetical protein
MMQRGVVVNRLGKGHQVIFNNDNAPSMGTTTSKPGTSGGPAVCHGDLEPTKAFNILITKDIDKLQSKSN